MQSLASVGDCIDFLSLPPNPADIEFSIESDVYRSGVFEYTETLTFLLGVGLELEVISTFMQVYGKDHNANNVVLVAGGNAMQCKHYFDASQADDEFKSIFNVRVVFGGPTKAHRLQELWGQAYNDDLNLVSLGTIKSTIIWV